MHQTVMIYQLSVSSSCNVHAMKINLIIVTTEFPMKVETTDSSSSVTIDKAVFTPTSDEFEPPAKRKKPNLCEGISSIIIILVTTL